MISEIFDAPDGSEIILARAELFLREKIEALGGELIRKLEAQEFGEYPGFKAVFFLPETTDEEVTADTQEIAHEYAEIYKQLDWIHEAYYATFSKYL